MTVSDKKCGVVLRIFGMYTLINQVFNENQVIVMLKSAAGGRACGRAGGRQLLVSAQ